MLKIIIIILICLIVFNKYNRDAFKELFRVIFYRTMNRCSSVCDKIISYFFR